jgi:hypothetical protein
MVRVPNSTIINPDFMGYFSELMKREMPARVCLELSECIDKVQGQFEVLKRAQIAITKRYCDVDAAGNIIIVNNNVTFSNINNKIKCEEELLEIFKESVELPLSTKVRIKETEVSTPYKIHLLKDVVEIVPEEQK